MRVLGLIPARGGSKGIPRKNIRSLLGKPLLQYTAEAARESKLLNRVIVSTEDNEIAEVARRCGVEVPFLRPAALAADDTPSLRVVEHAVRWMEEQGESYDALCLLQPTSPLRRAADIDGCIETLSRTGADSVITVLAVPAEHNPHWVYFRDGDGTLHLSTGESQPIPRRQDLPPAYHRDGAVYVVRWDVVAGGRGLFGGRTVGYEVERERSVNIDSPEDWSRAERALREAGTRA